MPRQLANLLLLFAGAIWGMGFVAQQTAMESVSPELFISARFLLAGLAISPLSILEYRKNPTRFKRSALGPFFLLGVLFFAAMWLQQIGLKQTTVTNAAFLTAMYVVLVPVLVFIFSGNRPALAVWLSAIGCLVGVFLLNAGSYQRLGSGDLLVLLGAVFWAFHVMLVGRFAVEFEIPITMACFQFYVCGCLALGCHLLVDDVFWPPGIAGATVEILYAGLISGGLAFTIQAVGQRYTSASVAAILLASESLFAAVFSAVLLGERLKAPGYIGCLIIFAAIAAVELLPTKQPTKNE